MGAGRPPKPRKQKILEGNFRKDRDKNEPEAKPISSILPPPKDLPPEGQKKWKKLFPVLVEKELITELDLEAFHMLCMSWSLFIESYHAVYFLDGNTKKKYKRTLAEYMAGRNSQTMPELTTMKSSMAEFKKFMALFGMSPSDRGKINLPVGGKKGETDPMEALLNAE